MSGKLINAKINLEKIKDDLLFKGEKGTYLHLSIWLNDEPNKIGEDVSIQQQTKKGEPKIFLGGGKYSVKKEPEQSPQSSGEYQKGKVQTGAMSNIDELPGAVDDRDLPFILTIPIALGFLAQFII